MNKSVLFLSVACLLFVACKEKEAKQVAEAKQDEIQPLAETEAEATPDFEFANGVITKYNGTEMDVVIPSQIQGQAVTEIWSGAFNDKQLTSVTIPNSVTRIEQGAFAGNNLQSITIGANVDLGPCLDVCESPIPAFNEDFDSAYNYNGMKMGTYKWVGNIQNWLDEEQLRAYERSM